MCLGLCVLCALGFRMGAANLRCGSARWLHHPKPDVDCSMQEDVANAALVPLLCWPNSLSPHACSTQGVSCENCLSVAQPRQNSSFFALRTERCRHMCRHRRSSSLVGIIFEPSMGRNVENSRLPSVPGVCSQSRIHFCWDSAVRSDFCSCCPAQARRRRGQRTVF